MAVCDVSDRPSVRLGRFHQFGVLGLHLRPLLLRVLDPVLEVRLQLFQSRPEAAGNVRIEDLGVELLPAERLGLGADDLQVLLHPLEVPHQLADLVRLGGLRDALVQFTLGDGSGGRLHLHNGYDEVPLEDKHRIQQGDHGKDKHDPKDGQFRRGEYPKEGSRPTSRTQGRR